jgi:hypothetical protein
MRRRNGRPGLIGTAARTAVIAGTATAVSGNVQQRQIAKAQQQAATAAPVPTPAPPTPVVQKPPAPAGSADLLTQLQQLADLKSAGMLDDAEFAAAKARLLGT